MGIGKNIKEIAIEHPDKSAINYEDSIITYGDFYRTICQIQQHLLNINHKKEPQKVAILIGNEPAFLELFFAVVTLGWTAIPFDPKWSEREAVQIMKTAEPDLIITSKQFSETTSYAFDLVHDIETLKKTPLSPVTNMWDTYSNESFYLGFTSGSTGSPKGFIRSHKSWLTSFSAAEQAFHYNQTDVILAPGPLCHSLSLFGAVHALHMGATFCLTSSFNADAICNILSEGKATIMYAVPTMLHGLAKQQQGYPFEKKLTFLSSGANLSPEVKKRLQHVFPESIVYEYYGASELSFISFASKTVTQQYPNSVGRPFPGARVTIRDQERQRVPNGEVGEIFIESNFLFAGYVNNPKETEKVLTNYGATVGDLGFLNDEGILTIVGRKKHMLISGGLNVYPEEVEKVIKEIEAVKEVMVVGLADDYWGQKLVALIKWKHQAQSDRLRSHCKAQLATYKRPKEFYEVDRFPYTPTGKIARKEVEVNIERYTSCIHL